jgi:hypothetical protein
MKIKVINFIHNDKPMHLKVDAELGETVNHLQQKYGHIKIHSIYPDEGPIIKFSPLAKSTEFVADKYFRCVLTVSSFLFCLVVAYVLVKEGVYKHY